MNTDNGRTRSIWMEMADVPHFPRLADDTSADVCIVGAGIAGLTTAYLLAREGRSVVVIDDGPIAGGETARTTAHLASYLDDDMTVIERHHGLDGLKLAYQSHAAAIDRIEQIVREEQIECDFARLDAYLFDTPGGGGEAFLGEELAASHRAGFADSEWVDRAPLTGFDTGRCLRFPRQGRFHPLPYLSALANAIVQRNGRIYCDTHAREFVGGRGAHVTTSQGRTIACGAIVVATNTPVNDLVAIHTKQAGYRTYVIGAPVPRGSVVDALYWDTLDPYHYIRLQPGTGDDSFDTLISGGEDHKTGQANDAQARYEKLEHWTRQRFPMMGEVMFRWSGQVMEPVDGLAFIGRNPLDADNVFIATGDSGMGMTHGTIAGMLLTDLIVGRANPWESLYSPSRKSQVKSAMEFVKENVNVAAQYADWVTGGEVDSVDRIAPDTGAILRKGATKLAVYRDPQGQLHCRSAVCTHLQCIVQWNSDERSWDCPCHGSRFDPTGKVVNGPAIIDLPIAELG